MITSIFFIQCFNFLSFLCSVVGYNFCLIKCQFTHLSERRYTHRNFELFVCLFLFLLSKEKINCSQFIICLSKFDKIYTDTGYIKRLHIEITHKICICTIFSNRFYFIRLTLMFISNFINKLFRFKYLFGVCVCVCVELFLNDYYFIYFRAFKANKM